MTILARARLLVLALATLAPTWAQGAGPSAPAVDRGITVQGEGRLSVVPDIVRLDAQIVEEGPKLDALSASVRRRTEALLDGVRQMGVTEKEIQTQAYAV